MTTPLRVPWIPDRVFRYVSTQERVDEHLRGEFFPSTFVSCREAEGKYTDRYEASYIHHSGTASSSDPNFRAVAMRSGIVSSGPFPNNMQISNITRIRTLPDAWLLCTTLSLNDCCASRFGPFCVEISEPRRVFEAIARRFVEAGNLSVSEMGPVVYARRWRTGEEPDPEKPAFLKPEEEFKAEMEYRMAWFPARPMLRLPRAEVVCEEIASLIRQVRVTGRNPGQ